jgi:hypothetical protein
MMPSMASGDDSLRNFFGSHTEDMLVEHVVREVRRGRHLGDVMTDPFIVQRTSEAERRALLDHVEIVRAVGQAVTQQIKGQL